jgi:hypothetical protein
MLYTLLTLLLPYQASPVELDFHTQFVLRAYRGYYDHLAATGLRDRKVLSDINEQTSYSMSILLWRRPSLWLSIHCFRLGIRRLKKSVIPLDEVSKLLKTP